MRKLRRRGGKFREARQGVLARTGAAEGGDIGEVDPAEMRARVREGGEAAQAGRGEPADRRRPKAFTSSRSRRLGETHRPLADVSEEIKEKLYKEAMEHAVRPLAQSGPARAAPRRDPSLSCRSAITLGDPAGVGPEVILKALLHPRLRRVPARRDRRRRDAPRDGAAPAARDARSWRSARPTVLAGAAPGRAARTAVRRFRCSRSSRLGARGAPPGKSVGRGRTGRVSLHRDRGAARHGRGRSPGSSPAPINKAWVTPRRLPDQRPHRALEGADRRPRRPHDARRQPAPGRARHHAPRARGRPEGAPPPRDRPHNRR